jgi:translation elongation factor EF-Tu-like GTPase
MSSILIRDLAHSAALDKRAMQTVRGGTAFVPTGPNVNVNVNLNQQIAQFQQIGVNVLNGNGVIGAGFVGPDVGVAASLWAANHAAF